MEAKDEASAGGRQSGTLYYGDCLDVMRGLPDEVADLIYLDPPFSSNRDYNVFFQGENKDESAQVTAFEDTWTWGEQSEREYQEIYRATDTANIATLLGSLRDFLGENDLMAYLVMMSSRLVEIKRLLKKTGTLYLHCDSTASHYLKLLLDGLFGVSNYKNEIIWKRSTPKGNNKINFPTAHDVILRYTKSDKFTFNRQFTEYEEGKAEKFYSLKDPDGRRYQLTSLLNPNKNRPNLTYEFLGVTRVWRWTKERMQEAYEAGRVIQTKAGGVPRYKRYLDEMPGVPVMDVWTDILPLQGSQQEYLGYPTQKPLVLLERIIKASSNRGDVVLDPFCGCGTAVHAAEKLGRRWIGIDITHLAISLISRRMHAAFPECVFSVEGTPKDIASARYLAEHNGLNGRYQFQYWVLGVVDAQISNDQKKGADGGSDGVIFAWDSPNAKKPFKINISVKSGAIPPNHIRELAGMLDKKDVKICVLLTLNDPSKKMRADAIAEGFYEYPTGQKFPRIQILTVQDLFDGKRPQYLDYYPDRAKMKKPVEERRIKYKEHSLFS